MKTGFAIGNLPFEFSHGTARILGFVWQISGISLSADGGREVRVTPKSP
jgi:hypothetical protein